MNIATWKPRYLEWYEKVFGDRGTDRMRKVYAMRLLEEALELAQAEGVLLREVDHITDQVFSKEAGDPSKEFGGVLVCAVGYAAFADLDTETTFETEFERIQDSKIIERIRYRNFYGDKIGMRKEP